MTTANNSFLLKQFPGTQTPVLLRGVFVRTLVDQVNRNTIALRPPRFSIEEIADSEDDSSEPEIPTWTEESNVKVTVRVENPLDSEQYVDIDRRVSSVFRLPDGSTVMLAYLNE